MFGRRRRARQADSGPDSSADDAASRGTTPDGPDATAMTEGRTAEAGAAADASSAAEAPAQALRADGPFDSDEVDLDEARKGRADLGGLLVPAGAGLKLQLQVNEKTGKAGSVMVVAGDAAVQLVAVAAPRSSGMWEQTRSQVAADAKRRDGSAEEASGPFGTEVRVLLPVNTPEGKKAVQPSRIVGIDGPRWMLRATFLGGATSNAQMFARLVEIVKGVVVVRGDRPMPPGDPIPLTPPQPGDGAEGGDAPGSSA